MNAFTLDELAHITQSKLIGDKDHQIINVNALEDAAENEASFLANPRYIEAMKISKAGVICIDLNIPVSDKKNYLVSTNPSLAFQKIIGAFCRTRPNSSYSGIHPTAFIHLSSHIGKNVTIGPFCSINKDCVIGDNTILASHVAVSQNVKIGSHCTIYAHVTIREYCEVHDRVIIQPGAVIGSCGFGYVQDENRCFIKLQQLGNVIIEEDVEIGANVTIDRARFKATKISCGTKIDNLVQIAHNVIIGQHNGIAAQTGIAGSSKTGNYILMGGQVGITGHVEVCDNVYLATRSGVSKSIKKPGKYRGSPVSPLDEYNKQKVYVRRLSKLFDQVKRLIERIDSLEKKLSP